MAIAPVQLLQPPSTGIASILQGAGSALTQLLQNGVQIGRDISNNASQQERDFLGERARLDSLYQRRGENLQNQINESAKFAENIFRDRRDTGIQQDQFAQNQALRAEDTSYRRGQDLISNARADNAIARDAQRAATADARYATEEERRAAEFAARQESNNLQLGRARRVDAEEILSRDQRDQGLEAVNQSIALAQDPSLTARDRETVLGSARQTFNQDILANPQVTDRQREVLGSQIGIRTGRSTEDLARERLDRTINLDEQKAATDAATRKKEQLIADPKAFDYSANPDVTDVKKRADVIPYEEGKALEYDRNAYIAAGGTNLTSSQKKKRAEFWDLTRQTATGSTSQNSADPLGIGALLNRYKSQ